MINCEICKKEVNFIPAHIRSHKINLNEYKEKFPFAPLAGEEYRKKISENTKKAVRRPEVREKYEKFLNSHDFSNRKPIYDRKDPKIKERQYNSERNKKISESRKKFWSDKKGKTLEELYGEEKSRKIKKEKSERMKGEKNPGYNKIYKKIGRKRGTYKGYFFRSLWEYSYVKFLENTGVNLEDVEYEKITIKYTKDNSGRTYKPDFFLINERKLIEIKSKWHLENDKELISIKKNAAESWCKENNATYHILTEDDFPIISFGRAKEDKDVIFL